MTARVAIVVTARPSWARVQTVIPYLRIADVDVDLVLTGAACDRGYGDLRVELPTATAIQTLLAEHSDWGAAQTAARAVTHRTAPRR